MRRCGQLAPVWLDRVFRAVDSIRLPHKSGSSLALRDAEAVRSGGSCLEGRLPGPNAARPAPPAPA
jgi:hypothetical protein